MTSLDEIMNADYPLPDPAWDYFEIYVDSQRSLVELQQLIQFMSTLENASPEADERIKGALDVIGQKLNQTKRKMDS